MSRQVTLPTSPRLRALLLVLALSGSVLCPGHAAAVERDRPGAKDHPQVSRYEGSILHNQGVVAFEQVVLPLGPYTSTPQGMQPSKSRKVEGKVLNYAYWGPKDRSELEVFRNYQAALAKAGFTLLYVCDEPERCRAEGLASFAADWTNRPATFGGGSDPLSRMEENGNYPPRFLVARRQADGDLYVSLTVLPPSSTERDRGVGAPYFLQVIETQPMRTNAVAVLDAAAMQKGIAAEGKVALYGVNFDTGSAVIRPDSKPQLDQMARLLAADTMLKVFIVGHTDNVGDFPANLALSQRRAEAIVKALVQDHKIAAQRLVARGVANLAPVSTNASEAGRQRNRRVELVAQ